MIRPSVPNDAPAIAALHADLFPQAWSEADVHALIAQPSAVALVVDRDGTVDGFVIGRVAADEAEILSIGVARRARGCGLGAELLATFAEAVKGRQAAQIYLEVAADNASALALYRRAGYAAIATRRGYYQRPDLPAVDAICMSHTV